jgi:hypothetical protein
MPSYQWINFVTGRQQLAQRLYDENQVWTTDAEAGIYILQALRMFNALTYTWKADFAFNPASLWTELGSLPNSPRLRTLTDVDCYTQMEYMLLEPSTGGVWTGTPQFSLSDFSQALQRRRDELLQITNCNQQLMPDIPLTPNTRRTVLPDNVIEVARVRYIPVTGSGGGYGDGGYGDGGYGGPSLPPTGPVTLYRDDTVAEEYYDYGYLQEPPGVPQTFMLSSEPPLSWDVNIPPNLPGTYEAVTLLTGAPFSPPTATLLNIPDDFAWVLIWGALSDLLSRESEAVDRQRADYCLKRWLDGVNLILKTPWIMLATVTGIAVNTQSIAESDRYTPEWDSTPDKFGPFIVTGGIDFFAAPTNTSIGLTMLGNAPVPVADGDFIQVSRSNWDTVLDLAQALGCFKLGGEEFQAALELEARAVQACAAENSRLKSTGAFSDILVQRGSAQERNQERYATAQAQEPQAASSGRGRR